MPESITAAFWIFSAIVAVIWTLILKLSVRVCAKSSDNGWDNALGYTVVCGLLALPASWMWESDSFLLTLFIPPFIWAAQTLALKLIYQLRTLHAWLLGLFHAAISSTIIGSLMVAAGFIAALILKKKIIADPIYFIKLLLRLIGIELPF